MDEIHGKRDKQAKQHTHTIRFIRRSNISTGRKVTYGSFVVDIKDHKEEKERTRLTVGGDKIEYPGDTSTRTAGLTTAKILINSVNTSGKAGAQIPQLGRRFTPLGERMQYVCNLTRFTRLGVTSHSQPLINAKHKFQKTNYLQTIF
jgi:hypothetical protein